MKNKNKVILQAGINIIHYKVKCYNCDYPNFIECTGRVIDPMNAIGEKSTCRKCGKISVVDKVEYV